MYYWDTKALIQQTKLACYFYENWKVITLNQEKLRKLTTLQNSWTSCCINESRASHLSDAEISNNDFKNTYKYVILPSPSEFIWTGESPRKTRIEIKITRKI